MVEKILGTYLSIEKIQKHLTLRQDAHTQVPTNSKPRAYFINRGKEMTYTASIQTRAMPSDQISISNNQKKKGRRSRKVETEEKRIVRGRVKKSLTGFAMEDH